MNPFEKQERTVKLIVVGIIILATILFVGMVIFGLSGCMSATSTTSNRGEAEQSVKQGQGISQGNASSDTTLLEIQPTIITQTLSDKSVLVMEVGGGKATTGSVQSQQSDAEQLQKINQKLTMQEESTASSSFNIMLIIIGAGILLAFEVIRIFTKRF